MSVRHSWRAPSSMLPIPEAAAKRNSKRLSPNFDPDNPESMARWRQQTSTWTFGSELDILSQPPFAAADREEQQRPAVAAKAKSEVSQTRLTFFNGASEEDVSVSHSEENGSIWPQGSDGGEQQEPPQETYVAMSLPLWREVCFIIVICLSMFTTQVGLGQVLLILPTIGEAFELTTPGDLAWLIAGYSLTVGTFILVSGRLGDVYGYKLMLIIGYAWFAVWSLVCGLAIFEERNGYVMFVFARVLSGIGPAITLPNGLAIFGSAYPDGMRKTIAFALFGACAPSGSIVGGAFASLFDLTFWPWTFYSFAIVLAILAILSVVFVPDIPRTRDTPKTWPDVVQRLDLLGGVVGVTSLVLINFAWNQASVVGWSHDRDYVYICLLLGIIMLPCFFVIEYWLAKEPLIPFAILTRDTGFVMACMACGWATFGIWVFYLLLIYSELRHGSPLMISAWLSPIAASGFAASIATGMILEKVRSSLVMVMSMLFFTIGVILVATAPVDQTYWAQTFVCSLVIPWGMDMSFPAGTIIMSNSMPKEHQGVAASLINTVVNYSISMGLGIASTVEIQVNNGGLTKEDILKGYRGGLYLGVGLAGLGLVISTIFAIKQRVNDPKVKRRSQSFRLPDE